MTGKKITEILNKTIDSIEEGKREVFDISESIRTECEKLKEQIENLKITIKKMIKDIDQLEIKEKKARNKLALVSKNFEKYSEADIRKAYNIANEYRVSLVLQRKEEKNLILERNNLEIKLKNNYINLEKAEKVVSQIGVALKYLSKNSDKVTETVDNLSKNQLVGIKIIKAQEEERRRVARDVHDGPAQTLANVILKTELTEKMIKKDPIKAIEELKDLKVILRSSLKDVRKIIYDLRPMSLDDLGLIPTIKRYADFFYEETGIEVNVKILSIEANLDIYRNLTVFRIIQESLNNIKKHSHAKRVVILIEANKKRFNLVIKDNGKGFDMNELNNSDESMDSGYGIIGIKERAKLLDGILEIKSDISKGTKITLTFPMEREDESHEQGFNNDSR
ncbi:sensor histidine kinase [Senegalia sp. (in: firmicutes)]|uniref:sensor histidine kinase n=2 Tax=Senegalia sp. (in: firmicutes) TaxID=1924098 RepID=UPI003F9642CB